ncbi:MULTISPECIES: HlyD family secretion protein [unclassified Gilliamella]|uniref:HlyD family secretion protein n=1 Tax=unclassified Gilliamella TaxID=2685620 RepID=UPI001C69DF0A|nr:MULTISPECIES: biotin/lipoyl-binding protein [unclassified Gilliamella]MCX8639752.1 HlyD family secretion protein [Gilliamella sp. B3172]QYN45901.1 HlyD family secretion protein [Gilliamella sp. ESL0405]
MKKNIKIPVIFLLILTFASFLIFLGSRNDAVTVAKSIKSGVLTADEINIAFQNVGGKLIKRYVQESQIVKKGDLLMQLEDVDTKLAINRLQAQVDSQKAMVAQEQAAIEITENETNLNELSTWRKIEEVKANLEAAKSTENLNRIEYNRYMQMRKGGNTSQSQLDNVSNAYTASKMQVLQIKSQLSTLMIGATPEQVSQFEQTQDATGMTLQSITIARQKLQNRQNQLAQLKAQLAQAETELEQLQINYKRLTLTAPEDGKVLKLMFEDGEMVPNGAPAVLLETDRKYIDIYVNEKMVNDYQPGTMVKANVIALDKEVKGKVRFATAAPSFADLRMTRERGQADLTSYQVRIYMESIPHLLTGMTLEVDQ